MATVTERAGLARPGTKFEARGNRVGAWRVALPPVVLLAVAVAWSLGDPVPLQAADPELVWLLRFMAAIKASLALVALIAVGWRLAAPVAPVKGVAYLLAAAGPSAACALIWQLSHVGAAALLFHASWVVLAAAAWGDAEGWIRPGTKAARLPRR